MSCLSVVDDDDRRQAIQKEADKITLRIHAHVPGIKPDAETRRFLAGVAAVAVGPHRWPRGEMGRVDSMGRGDDGTGEGSKSRRPPPQYAPQRADRIAYAERIEEANAAMGEIGSGPPVSERGNRCGRDCTAATADRRKGQGTNMGQG